MFKQLPQTDQMSLLNQSTAAKFDRYFPRYAKTRDEQAMVHGTSGALGWCASLRASSSMQAGQMLKGLAARRRRTAPGTGRSNAHPKVSFAGNQTFYLPPLEPGTLLHGWRPVGFALDHDHALRSEHPNICSIILPPMFGCSDLQAGIEQTHL
jgi:hypothetical protein